MAFNSWVTSLRYPTCNTWTASILHFFLDIWMCELMYLCVYRHRFTYLRPFYIPKDESDWQIKTTPPSTPVEKKNQSVWLIPFSCVMDNVRHLKHWWGQQSHPPSDSLSSLYFLSHTPIFHLCCAFVSCRQYLQLFFAGLLRLTWATLRTSAESWRYIPIGQATLNFQPWAYESLAPLPLTGETLNYNLHPRAPL